MNEAAMFQGASIRDLTGLPTANPPNPPVSAFPIFTAPTTNPLAQQIVVVREADAAMRAVRLGAGAQHLSAWNEDDIPGVFRAADTLVAPDAAIPTFVVNRSGTSRFMNLIVLKSASIVRQRVAAQVLGVAVVELDNVRLMMAKAHEWAVHHGFKSGFPTFHYSPRGAGLDIEIIGIKNAEVLSGQLKGPATWSFFNLQIEPARLGGFLVGLWTVAGRSPSPTVVLADESRLLNQYSGIVDLPPPVPRPSARTTVDEGRRGLNGNIGQISAVEANGKLHVLYYAGVLVHASRVAADVTAEWSSDVADGDGSGDHFMGDIGYENALVNRPISGGSELHAFAFTSDAHLRHGLRNANTGTWKTDDLDGFVQDNAGRVQAEFGFGLCALAEPNGRLHVFYHDSTKGNLRHAELSVAGTWAFTVLDGSGGLIPPDGPGTGPISGQVGVHPSAVEFDQRLYVFYDDSLNTNVRMAVRREESGKEVWSYHVLDGSHWRSGTVNTGVGAASAVVWDDRLSVFYEDSERGYLRHAWLVKGPAGWKFETLDGAGGEAGRVTAHVGGLASALATGLTKGEPSLPVVVAYMNGDDSKSLRWAVLAQPILL